VAPTAETQARTWTWKWPHLENKSKFELKYTNTYFFWLEI